MRIRIIFTVVLCMTIFTSCKTQQKYTKELFAMDTEMTVSAYGPNGEKAIEDARKEIQRLGSAFDRGNKGSEIYNLNSEKKANVSEETADIINTAVSISEKTEGAFDITIAPVMDLWGFYSKKYRIPNEDELKKALNNSKNISVDGNTITLNGDTEIDLGGIAKGYLSDRIVEIYKADGVSSGMLSLGGNIMAMGNNPDRKPWKVAIQNPDGGFFIGTISVADSAVITSGGYQRYFEQNGKTYHHIIDPKTGYPAESGLKSVTIISKNGAYADALSTALYVMGLDKGIEYWKNQNDFEAVFLTDDNKISITEGISDSFESDYEFSVIYR